MAGPVSPARKALQNKANLFVLAALLLDFGGYGVAMGAHVAGLARIAAVVALPLWVLGCMAYSESKGYSKWTGLLGILSCCGLFVLVLLPNKWVDGAYGGPGPGDYPRPGA